MNERDNQRLLRIALALVIAALVAVLAFNAFWLPGMGSNADAPAPTAPAASGSPPAGKTAAPAGIASPAAGTTSAPR